MLDRPEVIELFSGAGGAAWGLHLLGARHLACVELEAAPCETLRRVGFPAVHLDVRQWDPTRYPRTGAPRWWWASPPCQGWSTANQHPGAKGADSAERNGWPWTIDAVEQVAREAPDQLPEWMICENVRGSISYVQGAIMRRLRAIFPAVFLWVLNARDYGLPQSRGRMFLIGGPRTIRPPVPTHCAPGSPGLLTRPWVTMRDAIGVAWDHPSPLVSASEHKGASSRSCVHKLNRASDALWLATNGGRVKLTREECRILQGFPRGYPFYGTVEEQYEQIGNAVPPPLAELVGAQLLGGL